MILLIFIVNKLWIIRSTSPNKKRKLRCAAIVGKLKTILDKRLSANRDYLFRNKHGSKLKRNTLTCWFSKIRQKAADAYPEFADDILAVQFRDLRAKAGTDTFLSSDTESAQKQLGHASPQMTKRYIRKDKIVQPTKS
ncbi:tyrosine-type recombinase/integrase [Rodentibacter caecimuris]|uniref:tyrosine-type recombinase/integrase n=1 Tax=Rodentibacter caecimuris TaxID=1796644 RepID=UPI003AADD531